jgi:hypothetical protein
MRKRHLMMPLAGLAITAGALLSAGITAGPASAATGTGCPATKAGVPIASNVSASVSTTGTTSSYTFTSLVNEGSAGTGQPGLVNYCVYPTSPTADPFGHTVTAHGDNNAKWVYAAGGSNNFAFSRPGGNPSNIGLDGTSTPMGTATWASLNAVPDKQTIVLHINDPGVCASLYGAGTSATCFVRPTPPPPPGPDCTHGDKSVAYNAMPFDVENCVNPGIGFQATQTSEFGNEVNLAVGTPANPSDVQLNVDFQDFACQTGHWDADPSAGGPCVSAPGSTWTHPITANLYDPSISLTSPIATKTVTQTIPFRPSADTTGNCTGAPGAVDGSNKWWNANAIGGGHCQSSIAKVLNFDFGAVSNLPSDVVWTVSFNTSDYGTSTYGVQSCSSTPQGCNYDSLNVGDNGNTGGTDFSGNIDGAPYAGSDTQTGGAFLNSGGTTLHLQSTGFNGLRPLGEIIAH